MMTFKAKHVLGITSVLAAGLCLALISGKPAKGDPDTKAAAATYRSPTSLTVSPDGKSVYVTDNTAACVEVLDAVKKAKRGQIALRGEPQNAVLSADGATLYVAEYGAGSVAVIDTSKLAVTSRIAVGKWPTAIALAAKANRLYVCNQDDHNVSVINLAQSPPETICKIAVTREPSDVAISADEKRLVVANLLPNGVGTDPKLSAEVSIIDTAKLAVSSTIKLPPGSTLVRGLCLSPDGKRAYVVHGLGRFNLPITQLERGWVNTFAMSIIDVEKSKRTATMLLDDLTQGAADPHTVVCSADGKRLWISHSGVHEVSMINIGLVHELLTGKVPDSLASLKDGSQDNIWVRISKDPSVIGELENDLTALYIAGAIRRAKTGGKVPQGLALSPDNKTVFVGNYYSANVGVLDAESGKSLGTISLGAEAKADAVRRGELIFHDATRSFQRWHSCSSCHPNQGRVDGLRWDFLGDGIGNAKDTINLLYLHKTEPLNRRATLGTAREGAKNGLEGTHMIVPTEDAVDDLLAYLVSLRPRPSKYLTSDGKLSEAAGRGKALFEGKARCAKCHSGSEYTDKKMHNIGVLSSNEPDGRYDTPTLIEAWRTAPYLHDGRALTIKDVLTKHNVKNLHGKTKELSAQEIDDLVTYVLSL